MPNSPKLRPKPQTTAAIKAALDHEARIADVELYKQAVYDILVFLTTPGEEHADQIQIIETRREEIERRWHNADSDDASPEPTPANGLAGWVRISKTE